MMNALLSSLDPAEVVPDFDDVALLKFSQACHAELQKRAASSRYGDFVRIKIAADMVHRSCETIRRWAAADPELGKRTARGWVVSASRLMERCARRKR
jgi:hypothetical protein